MLLIQLLPFTKLRTILILKPKGIKDSCFASRFRIVVSYRYYKYRRSFEIASKVIRDTRQLYAVNIRVR